MMDVRICVVSSLFLLAACSAAKPVDTAQASARPDPQTAFKECSAKATAATIGMTSRRGAAESRLFSQCMAIEAPDDPAAMP